MAEISRAKLFGKLNRLNYKVMEAATIFCKMRTNPYVELEHWIHQILQLQDSDLHHIIRHYEIDPGRLAADLTRALNRLETGASAVRNFSDQVSTSIERGWVVASLMFNQYNVRTSHMLIAILQTRGLRDSLHAVSKEFEKIKLDDLSDNHDQIVGGSVEDALAAREAGEMGDGAAPGEESGAIAPAQMGKEEAIKRFCKDLTEAARSGSIDPIVGRDDETRQIVDILMRRRQNNPILVGEAGVGKTAVVEGFAHKIVCGDVPPVLRDVRLLELDVPGLQAGASMKGEFEQRLKKVVEEVQASETPVILFIDEAHTLIGAGGQAGTGDAAQILKPALARGQLRTVAATTWAEYKKHIEPDPALTRRFQVVQIDEPTEDRAILMMRKIASMLERHHRVQILDEALEASVHLSHRYIAARQLPDKSVSLLDTACARVAVGLHAVPATVDNVRKRIDAFETELEILSRESAVGMDHGERESHVRAELHTDQERLGELEKTWEGERDLVTKILDLRKRLRGPLGEDPVEGTGSRLEKAAEAESDSEPAEEAKASEEVPELSAEERAKLVDELKDLQSQLTAIQGENPLILPSCDASAIASVVADWTGIPVGRMVKNEVEAVLHLGETLGTRVLGQQHALDQIASTIRTSRAGLADPRRPIGVFLLSGPSGVGKTETAKALAEALYGGESNVITFNMSEYQEEFTASSLLGSPKGYEGSTEGGVLTEAVRRKPYSVVLFDEVEKAHKSIHTIFLQMFAEGQVSDRRGVVVDFKNTIILLTSNVGKELITSMCADPELMPTHEALRDAVRKPLLEIFPTELLGRLVVAPYVPLGDDMLREITKLQLRRVEQRLQENHGATLSFDDEVLDLIVSRCTERESGGRVVDAILSRTLLPTISQAILNRLMDGQNVEQVGVGVKDGQFEYSFA